jgi:hypothetical protein
MSQEYGQIKQQINQDMVQHEYDLSDTKITHVENLFIISYLTKALQDLLIRKSKIFQYPLLLIDLPLALAILIVNVERILYVKIFGYFFAHIRYDIQILKDMVMRKTAEDKPENWQERIFDGIRKFLRFSWGVIILLSILPIWPLIWVYNHIVQSLLIAILYYILMFFSFSFAGGFLLYYVIFATVTFLVSSITVPFIFRLSVYAREIFSLEKKSWKQVNKEARTAFVQFYQRLHGEQTQAVANIKVQYSDEYQAEGGVYYMLLKFLHYLKDKFWKLKKRKIEGVVEKIQDTTVEFVDEYYEEKSSYYFRLQSLSSKELRRTVIALAFTIVFAMSLAIRGSSGDGIIGPILLSFVDETTSQSIWINHVNAGQGYYENMVDSYVVLPNFLKFIGIGFDQLFFYFFQAYYFVAPLYLNFLTQYYSTYLNIFVSGVLWGTLGD